MKQAVNLISISQRFPDQQAFIKYKYLEESAGASNPVVLIAAGNR